MAEHDSKHCCISRHEKSLGVLTSKFVTLLKNSPNGVLDLKCVSNITKFNHEIIREYTKNSNFNM